MLSIQGSAKLCRIVVLNPKGGAGKTTLASTLAGYFASRGRKVAIIDMDKQGSSTHWLARRPAEYPVIQSVFSAPENPGVPDDYHVTLPPEIELAIVDTPAGIPGEDLSKYTIGSHAIIVPVMPSEFDIHAASRFIADLLLVGRVSRENRRLGVVANRVKERTIAFKQLMKFLDRLSIPVIGIIRDSQNYVSAAREGISIHELPPSRAGKELKHLEPLIEWLEQRLETPLEKNHLLRGDINPRKSGKPGKFNWKIALVAFFALVFISVLYWDSDYRPKSELTGKPPSIMDNVTEQKTTMAAPETSSSPQEVTLAEKPAKTDITEQQSDQQSSTEQPEPEVALTTESNPSPGETPAGMDTVEAESTRVVLLPASSDELSRKWRLSGVARVEGEYVALITDSTGTVTRRVGSNARVDGWRLVDAGPGFAVFENDGEEVRLEIGS